MAFSVDSATTTTPKAGDSFTINLTDASGSGMTVADSNGNAITVTAQDTTSITCTAPDLQSQATPAVDYDTAETWTVTDGGDSDTIAISVAPETGFDYHAITGSPWPAYSIYYNDPGTLTDGDKHYGSVTSGSMDSMGTDGVAVNPVLGTTQYTYWLYDTSEGIWGESADSTWGEATMSSDMEDHGVNGTDAVAYGDGRVYMNDLDASEDGNVAPTWDSTPAPSGVAGVAGSIDLDNYTSGNPVRSYSLQSGTFESWQSLTGARSNMFEWTTDAVEGTTGSLVFRADNGVDPVADSSAVTLTIAAAGSGVVTAAISANRTSGPAPLAVHFNSVGTTHSDGGVDTYRELGYHFTFDDSGSGTWTHSGLSKNAQIGGPLCAHVFDDPGTYTVKVRAQDAAGEFDDTSIVITVDDPDTTYATTNTVCISKTSDTTGAPAGATLLTNQTSWPTFEDDKRYLLRAGQDFTSFGNIGIKQVSGWQIGDFGSGATPITANVNVENGTPPGSPSFVSNATVYNLDAGNLRNEVSSTNLAFIRVSNTNVSIGTTTSFYGNGGHATIWPKDITVYECDGLTTAADYNVYALANGIALLGGEYADPGQHNVRFPYATRCFAAHNFLYGASSGKTNIKYHSRGEDATQEEVLYSDSKTAASRYGVVADNKCGKVGGESNLWSIILAPQNNIEAEGLEDMIAENNTYDYDFQKELGYSGRRITTRGNSNTTGTFNENSGVHDNALSAGFLGPYYTDDDQIIPGAPA